MDRAKEAVTGFLEKHGKKDTTVHEEVAPAVVKETVAPQRHEEVTTAVDKEVHQDHYHTSVQPVKDREVLPEKHAHNLVATEHRQYEHGDSADTKRRVADEAGRFQDERRVADTQHTHSAAPTVGGEHVHHHVHETIQPVVQKETIQPEVVHTTIPVHEVHHNAAQHHSTSTLPTMTMEELRAKGGTLDGRDERTDFFDGEPRGLTGGGIGSTTGGHSSTRDATSGITGSSATRTTGDVTSSSGIGSSSAGLAGSNRDTTSGLGGTSRDTTAGLTGGNSGTAGHYGTDGKIGTSDSTAKPSMMSKLDPRVDADGDGKKGFMK